MEIKDFVFKITNGGMWAHFICNVYFTDLVLG